MKKIWALIPVCLFFHLSVLAGVVFDIENKDHRNGDVSTTHAYAQGKNLKMEIEPEEDGKKGEILFDGEQVIIVDHDEKSYMVFDEEMVNSISGTISQATSMMEQALKNLPEEQRAMAEKMMKQNMPKPKPAKSTRQVKKTGERKKINGYPCIRHDSFNKGQKTRELWVTDWDNVDGGKDAQAA